MMRMIFDNDNDKNDDDNNNNINIIIIKLINWKNKIFIY